MASQLHLYLGHNLLQSADPLQAMAVAEVAARIDSDARLRQDTESLRNLLRMDKGAYSQQKRRLPYFCVSAFRQNLRRIERFEVAYAMAVDVDWGATDQAQREAFRQNTYADPRCVLAYRSPSGTNWRLVYELAEPIRESAVYRAVYQRLVSDLHERYPGLRGLDERTHDCTRANFLAFDPEVRLNLDAVPVAWRAWVADMRPTVFGPIGGSISPVGAGAPTGEAIVAAPSASPETSSEATAAQAPPPYREIRQALKPARQNNLFNPPPAGRPSVPVEILLMIPPWRSALAQAGFRPTDEKAIAHGLKVRLRHGRLDADVTIYYGKRGFRFVVGAQAGADGATGAAAAQLLENVLYAADLPDETAVDFEAVGRRSFLGAVPAAPQAEAEGETSRAWTRATIDPLAPARASAKADAAVGSAEARPASGACRATAVDVHPWRDPAARGQASGDDSDGDKIPW